MSQWNDPGKVEESMAEVVGALTLDVYSGDSPATAVTVNTGMDDEAAALPLVTCAIVSGGEEWVRGTGNMESKVAVRIVSSGNITLAEHRTRCATVLDAFMADDIAATLSAAIDDFHVFQVIPSTPEPTRKDPRGEDGFVFVTEMMFDVKWCGSTIN